LKLIREDVRPCACGAGDYIHQTWEYDIDSGADWPGLLDEWIMRCAVCRNVYADKPQSFAAKSGPEYRWVRRDDSQRYGNNFEKLMKCLITFGKWVESRYSKRWHALFEGRSPGEVWKTLDHPDNVQRKPREDFLKWVEELSLKKVLDAHFIQGNHPFILSVLGVKDMEIETEFLKIKKLQDENLRLWEEMKKYSYI
jgi:hypothetical protein